MVYLFCLFGFIALVSVLFMQLLSIARFLYALLSLSLSVFFPLSLSPSTQPFVLFSFSPSRCLPATPKRTVKLITKLVECSNTTDGQHIPFSWRVGSFISLKTGTSVLTYCIFTTYTVWNRNGIFQMRFLLYFSFFTVRSSPFTQSVNVYVWFMLYYSIAYFDLKHLSFELSCFPLILSYLMEMLVIQFN